MRSSSKCLQWRVRQQLARAASLDREECARHLRHQFAGPENIGLPVCQIQRLLAADRGWGGASAHREAEGRRVPTEFLPNSWLFEVGVDQFHRALRARALSLTTNAQGSQARLGPRLMPPQSQLLAYGPASPVNRSLELVLRSRRRLRAARPSPVRRRPQRAPESATPHTRFDGMPSDARLR